MKLAGSHYLWKSANLFPFLIQKQTIELIRQGDRQAFDRLFLALYEPLCRYAFSFLNDWEETEEVVQNVFLKLWESRSTLAIHTSLKSYLFTATHNACINQIQHYKVRQKYLDYVLAQELQSDTSDRVIADELHALIEKSISDLPEQRQLIFKMSRYEGLKYKEIAEQLNISVKTVEAQMGKALSTLRDLLKDYLPLLALLVAHM